MHARPAPHRCPRRSFARHRRGPVAVAAPVAALLLAALLWAPPSQAFEYTVEGTRPQRVTVDDDLFSAGVAALAVGYGMTFLMGGIFFGSAMLDDSAAAQHNGAVGLALAAPPVVNGLLLGRHLLDEQEAYDAQEGWAALPALAAWGFSAAQVVGLGLLAGSLLFADRVTVGE